MMTASAAVALVVLTLVVGWTLRRLAAGDFLAWMTWWFYGDQWLDLMVKLLAAVVDGLDEGLKNL
jgi:hypothetical protein